MVPGLTGAKMSASEEDSKIDLLDDPKSIKKKIAKAFCEEGNITENGVLSFCKFVLYPVLEIQGKQGLHLQRTEENGGDKSYMTFQELEDDFGAKTLHPGDLKSLVVNFLSETLEPVRKRFQEPDMKTLLAKAYPPPKKEKKVKAGAAAEREVTPARLDIRIGKIVEVKPHPDADSLFVESIDVGEEKPRTVVSGLRAFMTQEELMDRTVVLLLNLKPQKMRGILSEGMLLAASKTNMDGNRVVQPLIAPEGSKPGDRVCVDGYAHTQHGDPDAQLNPKKKVWETLQPDFLVSDECVAEFKGSPFKTALGNITASLQNATIS